MSVITGALPSAVMLPAMGLSNGVRLATAAAVVAQSSDAVQPAATADASAINAANRNSVLAFRLQSFDPMHFPFAGPHPARSIHDHARALERNQPSADLGA